MGKIALFALLFLALAGAASAARISGIVYDFELNSASNVLLTIDTTPTQKLVVQNGSYSLNVPAGSYSLNATAKDGSNTIESITVKEDGEYTLDLILFPSFTDDPLADELDDVPQDVSEPIDSFPWAAVIGIAAVAIIVLVVALARRKKKPAPISDDKENVLAIIKRNGGRVNQRELRKELPFSEAKISLIITELEHDGKVRKIRKGRANVISMN